MFVRLIFLNSDNNKCTKSPNSNGTKSFKLSLSFHWLEYFFVTDFKDSLMSHYSELLEMMKNII